MRANDQCRAFAFITSGALVCGPIRGVVVITFSGDWLLFQVATFQIQIIPYTDGLQYSTSNLSSYPLLQFLDLILECLSSLRLKIFQFKLELFDLTFGWLASSLWIGEAILTLTEFLLNTCRLDKKKKIINFADYTQERSSGAKAITLALRSEDLSSRPRE